MSGQRRRRSRGGPATGFTIKACFTPEQMAGISWGLKMIIVGYSGYMGDILEFTLWGFVSELGYQHGQWSATNFCNWSPTSKMRWCEGKDWDEYHQPPESKVMTCHVSASTRRSQKIEMWILNTWRNEKFAILDYQTPTPSKIIRRRMYSRTCGYLPVIKHGNGNSAIHTLFTIKTSI